MLTILLTLLACDDYITPNQDTGEVFCIHPEWDTGTILCCDEFATEPDDCWEE